MKSYALNYIPQSQTFGQQFLYDGEHDFEYWKSQNPKANYSDYWGIRDAFVQRNFESVERLAWPTVPIKDVANITVGFSDSNRIAQTISSRKAWESVRDITNGTGTIMSLDLETIGDILTKHQNGAGINIVNDYSGITEVGLHFRNYVDGIVKDTDTFTLAVGLNSKRAKQIKDIIASYDNSGYNALTKTEQRLIDSLSTYGHSERIQDVFTTKTIDGLDYTVLTEATEKATADPFNKRAVHMGFEHLRDMWGNDDKVYARKLSQIQDITRKFINEAIADSNTAMISANSAFEATVLSDWGIDLKTFMDNSADLIYANTAIAQSKGIPVYGMQKSAILSHGVTADAPANVQNSANAAGLDITEFHHGGGDAKIQVDIATNKVFIDNKGFYETVLDTIDDLENMHITDYENSYFYIRNGQLDKNKLDHAVVDGKATQSYSIRGQYYQIDKEHSGYTTFQSMKEGTEKEAVYVLSMVDDNGTRFSKQFTTEQESLTWLNDNASIMAKNQYAKIRKQQRKYQTELTETDWGRRMFDSLFNPNDTRITSGYEEINGFEGLKEYLDIVNDIEKQIKDTKKSFNEIVTDDFLVSNGFKSNYQQRAFKYTYNKIESEKAVLEDIVEYIDNNMQGANNLQKTVALKEMRNAYINHVQEVLGYTPYTPKSKDVLISDALGIDIKVGDEYKRVNGDSVSSIRHDLNRIFKNSTQEEIEQSVIELGERGVLDIDIAKDIAKNVHNNTTSKSQYYNSIYSEISIALGRVTEPIVAYESPIAFFNNLDAKGLTEQQITAIENKLQSTTIQDIILQSSQTKYQNGKNKSITLSKIRENKLKTSNGIFKYIQADDIIEKAKQITFSTKDNPIFDSTIDLLSDELGYSDKQKKIFKEMFIAKDSNGFKNYAISGRDNIQSFIIKPTENSSGFLLLTNNKHATKVAEILSTSTIEDYMKSKNKDYVSRNDIAEIFKNEASVVELKKIKHRDIIKLSDIFDEEEVKAVSDVLNLNNNTVQLNTMNQGQNLEKFVIPSLNVYKTDKGVINGNFQEAGEDFLIAYRKTGGRLLDAIESDDFSSANYFISSSQNEVLRETSSPSGYRGFNGKRTLNPNYNDISHGFFFNGEGILETLKLQIKDIANKQEVENPLYQLTEMIGLATGDIREGTTDYLKESQIDSILNSPGFNEFFSKNIITGTVLNDKVVSERISNYSNTKREAFNKNILGMMIDEMHSSSSIYGDEFIKTFEKIQKASPYMTQILSESNVHRYMFSFIKPGEIIDLGLINSSMRPTYQQILNALRFDPDSLDKQTMDVLSKGDVIVGPVSRTKIEQAILNTFNFNSPSGNRYGTEERLLTAPFKQMNDIELVSRYQTLDKEISGTTDIKLQYAYDLFKKEHMSLYEGKWFGAPMLLNQEPFSNSDIKKVKINAFKDIKTETERKKVFSQLELWSGSKWDENTDEWTPIKIKYGDTLAEVNGHKILWEGPATYLTKENINDLLDNGETTIIPSNRMISDIKMMAQQEKATVHFSLIDDEFMKKHGNIFDSKEEALDYMQQIFDKVSGYEPSIGYRPMLIGNLSSYKHGTAIAPDSAFRIIVHEYQKAGELLTLKERLENIEYFKDWDFEIYDKMLLSNQRNQKGAEEAINILYDMIMQGDSKTDKNIQKVFENLSQNNIAYLEIQRMLNNEIMGSEVMLDERMTQAIRLREIERGFSDERSFENLYIDALKKDVANGYYEGGNMLASNPDSGLDELYKLMDRLADDNINTKKMKNFSKNIKEQEKTILGIKDSLKYYVGGIDVNEQDILKVNINDVLKNLPDKGINYQDVQDLIFYSDGKPSNFLKEISGNKYINASSIYLDFGTNIKIDDKQSFSGVLVPIFNTHTVKTNGDKELFLTTSQKGLIRFLNAYKENIGTVNGSTEIAKAINNLYKSFAREMNPFDKDSLLYKTAGKILLPHSAQSLAQDEVAPIVEAMSNNKIIIDSIEKEREIRSAVINGDFSRIDELDEIIQKRTIELQKIENRINSGDQADELFKLTQLSLTGDEYKGFEVIDGKKYFSNAFEMNLDNMKRHGLDSGLIGYQIFEDAFYMPEIGEIYQGSGTLQKFESNAKFNAYLKDGQKIQERIIENLRKEGIKIDDGKELLRALNNSITKDTDTSYMEKIYRSMSFLGEEYLQDVGIITREVWRPPVFSAQIPGRIFLNNDVGNNQVRVLTGGSTSAINNVDFDGDMFMMSFSLNGNGGLRTMAEDYALRQSYFESLKANNPIIAKLIGEGAAFKKDSLNDISYFRLKQLERFDKENYVIGLNEWVTNNKIKADIDDLTESQLLKAAHSIELRNAYGRFSSSGNMLTNENVILASITSRVRKDNIGSISTPNYKLRDTLLALRNKIRDDKFISKEAREASFEILQDLTSISSSKLLEVTEQTSIDVKHIFDAIDLAQTPKWAKGMSLLFGKDKEQGLKLMIEAVNKSTFNLSSQEEINNTFNTIIETNRNTLREEIENNKIELATLTRGTKAYKDLEKAIAKKEFTLQFKALYDSASLEHAQEFHKYILRNKNASTRLVAEELIRLDELIQTGFFKGMEKGAVMDDMLDVIKKASLELKLNVNPNHIYFEPGSIKSRKDVATKMYMFDKKTTNNAYFTEIYIKDGKIFKKNRVSLSDIDTNFKELNNTLNNRFPIHINANQYLNGFATDNVDLAVKRTKISRTLEDIINYQKQSNEAFNNFFALGSEKKMKYGLLEHDFISKYIKKESIDSARELFKDYEYYISNKTSKDVIGVEALIRNINESIANNYNPDNITGTNISNSDIWYDDITRKYINDKLSISNEKLQSIHEERILLGSFDTKEYTAQKAFLKNNLYDIITSEQDLKDSFNVLENIRDSAIKAKLDLPDNLEGVIANKDKTITDTINNIKNLNTKTIKQVQNNIYNLFNSTAQMDIKFRWKNSTDDSVVGFGKYIGTEFSQLSEQNIKEILSVNFSDNILQSMSEKERYAFNKTQELLTKYIKNHSVKNNTGIIYSNVHDSVKLILEKNEQFKLNFEMDFINRTINNSVDAQSKMKRKSLTDIVSNIKMPNIKTIGIVAGSLAALGMANNLLHNDKHKSPVSPEFSNDHNDPGFKNNSVQSSAIAPPSKKTIYVDKPSGLQFKVSAKTNNYISDVNNAKLISLSNGGQANVYSQQDTSGVTDNWLANKFAELTN